MKSHTSTPRTAKLKHQMARSRQRAIEFIVQGMHISRTPFGCWIHSGTTCDFITLVDADLYEMQTAQ